MYKCCLPARSGGLKGIPKDVRKQFRVVLKHWPWLIDLLSPEQFCKDTINKWCAEMDRNWRCDETSDDAADAQRNDTQRKP